MQMLSLKYYLEISKSQNAKHFGAQKLPSGKFGSRAPRETPRGLALGGATRPPRQGGPEGRPDPDPERKTTCLVPVRWVSAAIGPRQIQCSGRVRLLDTRNALEQAQKHRLGQAWIFTGPNFIPGSSWTHKYAQHAQAHCNFKV